MKLRELFERSKYNQEIVDKFDIKVGRKIFVKGEKAIITKVNADLFRADYQSGKNKGWHEGIYFDEFEKYQVEWKEW